MITLKAIPLPVLKRLPLYYDFLKTHYKKLGKNISTVTIAQALHLNSIQVRKDLEFTGLAGRPKLGFNAVELLTALENCLGWDNTKEAFLAGVGNLGRALLSYQGFNRYGLEILAGFDVNESIINTEIGSKKIFHISKLTNLVKRMKVKIGILTVPADQAQETAMKFVKAGIEAIWNFTPHKLELPLHVIIQNENFATSLAVLSRKLQIKKQKKLNKEANEKLKI